MAYLTKANTALLRELEQKIIDVLSSFAYDEIISAKEIPLDEIICPYRFYERENFTLKAVFKGDATLCAEAEIIAVAINSLLGIEAEEIDVKIGHGKLDMSVSGEISVLENLDEENEYTEDVLAVCDLLDGYGLSKLISADLTKKEGCDGVCFVGYAGKTKLLSGGRCGTDIVLKIDLKAILDYKLNGTELKEKTPVVLVASDMAETAYEVAFGLRRQGLKTEGYVLGFNMYDAEEYCVLKGIPTLIFAGEEKVIMKNVQTGETAETTLEKLLGK